MCIERKGFEKNMRNASLTAMCPIIMMGPVLIAAWISDYLIVHVGALCKLHGRLEEGGVVRANEQERKRTRK